MATKLVKQDNFDKQIAQKLNKNDNGTFARLDWGKANIANGTNINTITSPGSYYTGGYAEMTDITNVPEGNRPFILYVVGMVTNEAYLRQIAIMYDSNRIYTRSTINKGLTWTAWTYSVSNSEMNALVEKIPLNLTAETGYKITFNDSFIFCNIAYICCSVKKTDDSNFTSVDGFHAFSIPQIGTQYAVLAAAGSTPGGSPKIMGQCVVAAYNKKCFVGNVPDGIDKVYITGWYQVR